MRQSDYDRLLAECAPAAQRVALAVLRSPATAERVAHEAFLTVVAKLNAGAKIEDPKGYVTRTAWRLARAESQLAANRAQVKRKAPARQSRPRPSAQG